MGKCAVLNTTKEPTAVKKNFHFGQNIWNQTLQETENKSNLYLALRTAKRVSMINFKKLLYTVTEVTGLAPIPRFYHLMFFKLQFRNLMEVESCIKISINQTLQL